MPNRTIKDSICTSDTIDQLTAEEERFFYRLLTRCDDYGRFDARPRVIRSVCFPLKLDEVSDEMVDAWLRRLEAVGLIMLYECNGRPYLQMVTWSKHQQIRAKKSKFPAPDSACNHLQSSDSNGKQMSPSSSSISSDDDDPPTPQPVDNSMAKKDGGTGSFGSLWDEMMMTFAERGIDLDVDELRGIELALEEGRVDMALVKRAADKCRGKVHPTEYFRTVWRDWTGEDLSALAKATEARRNRAGPGRSRHHTRGGGIRSA
ncbi:MAG: hypothetical protein QME79_14155 [Bacillota bacterium]|nr:hypothetical protein [Bacillota bacterium]